MFKCGPICFLESFWVDPLSLGANVNGVDSTCTRPAIPDLRHCRQNVLNLNLQYNILTIVPDKTMLIRP